MRESPAFGIPTALPLNPCRAECDIHLRPSEGPSPSPSRSSATTRVWLMCGRSWAGQRSPHGWMLLLSPERSMREIVLHRAHFTSPAAWSIMWAVTAHWEDAQMAVSSMATVTVPQVEITLDQLAAAIRQLDSGARSEIARVLVDTELDARMSALIKSLCTRAPADNVPLAEIQSEVDAVREQRRRGC